MGADKMATEKKGGGFFNLFDWNRKSRKKLFATGNGSPDGKKQVRRSEDNLPSTRFHLPDEDDYDNDIAMAIMKENSDYSYTSSVTDGEGNGNRAPGVVARLMGLDTLPTNGVSESCPTPCFESRFVQENHHTKRVPELEARGQFADARNGSEVYTGKLPDWRQQRMPSSPIERFQHEILPPRSAKSLPINPYKLLSPIKNPKFAISSKDAAHIMETAAKILQPGFQANYSGKVAHIDPSSLPLMFRDSKEYVATPQRIVKQLGLSRGQASELNPSKCLQGKSLNRSWNGLEGSTSYRSSPGREQSTCIVGKSKGKSVSLAVQAKANVQKRESRSYSTQKEQDGEVNWSQSFKDQTSLRSQKKVLPPNPPTVLKQNNHKQNCLASKDRLSTKRSLPSHHGKKVLSGSGEKNKTLNRLQGISKGGCSRGGSQTINIMKELPSSRADNLPRKKRLIDGNQGRERWEKMTDSDDISVGRNEKEAQSYSIVDEKLKLVEDVSRAGNGDMESFAFTPPIKPTSGSRFPSKIERKDAGDDFHLDSKGRNIQTHVIIDENMKQAEEDNPICGTDVASFTFKSPLLKPASESGHSTRMGKKVAAVKDCGNAFGQEWSGSDAKMKKCPSLGLNMMGGDSLSILLEEKLRGLAFESELCSSAPFRFLSLDAPARNSPPSESIPPEKLEPQTWQVDEVKLSGIPSSKVPTFDGQGLGKKHELQLAENLNECCCSSSSTYEEPDHYASPFSVLEANFSNESCNSCESYDSSSYGVRMCRPSSPPPQNVGSVTTLGLTQMEAEPDLSDSASSSLKVAMEGGDIAKRMRRRMMTKTHEQELEYVREILFTANVNPRSLIVGRTGEKLDPLLFNLLESKRSASELDGGGGKFRRKLLFDCARECLDSTQCRHFRAGYRSWARGMSILKQEDLADEIYMEISAWGAMGDWMVDELVDKDMSSQLGKTGNFGNDAFEVGVEIEKKIVASLIDEVVAQLLV